MILNLVSVLTLVIGSQTMQQLNDPSDIWAKKRSMMVQHQIAGRGINNSALLAAMEKVPRHLFVPESFVSLAYDDTALPIGYEQTISQPYMVAFMIEAAQLRPGDTVLEIGTGSGYNAAILSLLCKEVYTVEIVRELGEATFKLLHDHGYSNVHGKISDGSFGWPHEKAAGEMPKGNMLFDAIIVTAAPEQVPPLLLEQLKIGGRLVMPVGTQVAQKLIRVTKTKDGLQKDVFFPVRFVPLVSKD
jgi:protein-L-isoaspartate(D-aspartate) O-methyltransferase